MHMTRIASIAYSEGQSQDLEGEVRSGVDDALNITKVPYDALSQKCKEVAQVKLNHMAQ
jgi:hypothetical protein